MVKWNQTQTTDLNDLWMESELDPTITDGDYIRALYEGLTDGHVLKSIKCDKFRQHYCNKAVLFLTDWGLKGALLCVKFLFFFVILLDLLSNSLLFFLGIITSQIDNMACCFLLVLLFFLSDMPLQLDHASWSLPACSLSSSSSCLMICFALLGVTLDLLGLR